MDLVRCRGRDGDGDYRRAESGQVIGRSGAVRVLVATRPVDLRKGAEGLAALVRDMMGAEPFDGAVCFRARARRSGEALLWDGTGVCLFAKRLEGGRFQWPKIENGVMRLSATQLSALIEGLDWRRVRAAKDTRGASRRFRDAEGDADRRAPAG
jgi:transposase